MFDQLLKLRYPHNSLSAMTEIQTWQSKYLDKTESENWILYQNTSSRIFDNLKFWYRIRFNHVKLSWIPARSFSLLKPKAMSSLSATRYGNERNNPIRLDLYYRLITTPPATTTKSCSMGWEERRVRALNLLVVLCFSSTGIMGKNPICPLISSDQGLRTSG